MPLVVGAALVTVDLLGLVVGGAVALPAVAAGVAWAGVVGCYLLAGRHPGARPVGVVLAWSVPVSLVVLVVALYLRRPPL